MLSTLRRATVLRRTVNKVMTRTMAQSALGEMNVDEVVDQRKQKMSPTYNIFQTFDEPVVLEQASGQYCYGPNGEKYLDLLAHNLTISVGHGHPKVKEAAKTQIDRMMHTSSMYYSEPASQLAEKLTATFPERSDGEKWKVKFAVTGTEAVEIALQVARVVTGNTPVLSLTNSYHGSYGTAMAASGGKACRHDLPECGGIFHLQAPIYEHKDNVDTLVDMARTTISASTSGHIGAFLFEPVQGYGGIHVLPADYLQKMAKVTHEHGGLVIADEIQTGYGRMGEKYWAYEMSGVEPDMVIVAKGLGCGFPISAVVAKESVFDKFLETDKFIFSTYGANPVCAAAACAVLDVLEEEKVQERAFELGKVVEQHLTALQENYEDCWEVRGKGLMWGIELEPGVAKQLFEGLKDLNCLVGLGGPQKNVLRVMPPMCLTKEDLDWFYKVCCETLDNIVANK